MKLKCLLTVLIFVPLCFTACYSFITVPYSFSDINTDNGTASLTLVRNNTVGVRMVDLDSNYKIPEPIPGFSSRRHFSPVTLPAGRPLDIRVYIFWNKDIAGQRRLGVFKCPPLEAGKKYKLWFSENKLILTYANVTSLKYSNGNPGFVIVHSQDIPFLSLE